MVEKAMGFANYFLFYFYWHMFLSYFRWICGIYITFLWRICFFYEFAMFLLCCGC